MVNRLQSYKKKLYLCIDSIKKNMRYCYISRNYKDVTSAGNKAKTDIETIMQRMGFVNIGLSHSVGKGVMRHFFRNLFGIAKAMCQVRKGDVLVLQYPLKKYYEAMCNVAHWKGAKVITQIHDLNSFRSKRLTPSQEMRRLGHSDVVIAHNDTMKAWLEGQGCPARLTTLGIFDYLSPTPTVSGRKVEAWAVKTMFFLGNLNPKSNKFVYDLGSSLRKSFLYLYGNHYHEELLADGARAEYKGYAVDMELMKMNHGDFGLSWYGDSLSEGKGKIGEYMSYNNPHKVSLYLRCHAPVIMSKTAGLASFVEANGIGITVDTLEDIDDVVARVTDEEYVKMRDNVVKVSERIASGYYFEHAFERAVGML